MNEALKDESWIIAMQEELNQFITNDVWELVSHPMSFKIIGTKWVFKNKLDQNGVISRNKARLVAQGYNQQEDIDYDETYALVARLDSIRILLAYACDLNFKLFQMDVKSAFLNGFINEEVYMAQPPGFIDFKKPHHVYKLKKALYGLKQAPKACYDRLKAFLIKHEYNMGMFSKKQTALAISMIEVEYISAEKACQQALWMKQALNHYDVRLDDVPIMCDNKGAIDLSKNLVQYSRTKHIEIHHHFLRDNVQKGHISIEKVSSEDNIADILTKPLKRESFDYLRLGLGMMEHVPSMFGHIGFECLLDINEQIIHRFILEFYSQYRVNYTLKEVNVLLPTSGHLTTCNLVSPTSGPYQTNPPSPDEIKLYIQEEREGRVTRIRHDKVIDVEDNQILTREIVTIMKTWVEIIRENVFCIGGNRDHVLACLCHMLYCITRSELYNLAFFVAKRMEFVTKQARGRSSTSSSSAFGQPFSSHPNDDDNDGNDKGTSHESTPSPTRFVNTLSNDTPQILSNPPNVDPNMEAFYTCQTKILNCQVKLRDEQHGGIRSIVKDIKNLWRKKK
ncbi:copia protein [Tanacetum coccineum]